MFIIIIIIIIIDQMLERRKESSDRRVKRIVQKAHPYIQKRQSALPVALASNRALEALRTQCSMLLHCLWRWYTFFI
jgi:hypothetical protein